MEEMSGKTHHVLIEGLSKRSDEMLMGRNTENAVVVFPKGSHKPGEYVKVKIHSHTAATLIGETIPNE
jgi:tRNA-2-methylthio-N6-dimethylallyladenosine synthase